VLLEQKFCDAHGRAASIVEKRPEIRAAAPNEIWTVDFKGWWRARDGQRCEPLTVWDAFNRFVLAVEVLSSAAMRDVRRCSRRRVSLRIRVVRSRPGCPQDTSECIET